jgi:hypothetical protein
MNAEIGAASFVAIDTEFTGIGNDQDLHAKDMSARYKAVRKGVQSHGLFEIGLSMWRRVEPPTGAPLIPSGPLFTLRAPQKPTSLRAPLITTCDAFLAACTARPPARSYPSEAEGGSDGGLGWQAGCGRWVGRSEAGTVPAGARRSWERRVVQREQLLHPCVAGRGVCCDAGLAGVPRGPRHGYLAPVQRGGAPHAKAPRAVRAGHTWAWAWAWAWGQLARARARRTQRRWLVRRRRLDVWGRRGRTEAATGHGAVPQQAAGGAQRPDRLHVSLRRVRRPAADGAVCFHRRYAVRVAALPLSIPCQYSRLNER